MVLFTPDIIHGSDCKRYNTGHRHFHEAGFDAFCVGFGKYCLRFDIYHKI